MGEHTTPGPWRVEDESLIVEQWPDDKLGGHIVAAVYPHPPRGRAVNARLIAAAPDMLAALEAVTQPEPLQCEADWELAEAAIAKAKGE